MASTQEENTALIREFLTTVVTGGDTDALGIFLSGEAVDRQPVEDTRVNSEPVGATYWRALTTAGLNITIDDIVAADENVAVRGTVTGIHRDSLLDEVPTGCSFGRAIAWFFRIENGQILETWSLPSESRLMWQLDALFGAREPNTSHKTEQHNHETRQSDFDGRIVTQIGTPVQRRFRGDDR